MERKDALRLARIFEHPDYIIDKNGNVYNRRTLELVKPVSNRAIVLDGTVCQIDTLIIHSWVGILPFPIGERSVPRNSGATRLDYLRYIIHSIIRNLSEPDMIYIDNLPFKIMPYTNNRCAITENGVVYDSGINDFLYRNFLQNRARVSYHTQMGAPQSTHRGNLACALYLAYHGDIPDGMEVDHIDNIPYHDFAHNLQLLTKRENKIKYHESLNHNRFYSIECIEAAFRAIAENRPNSEIAEILGLPFATRSEKHRVSNLIYKFKYLPGYYDDLKQKYDVLSHDNRVNYESTRLTKEQVEEIQTRLANGEKGSYLANEYRVSAATISHIKTGCRGDGSRTK